MWQNNQPQQKRLWASNLIALIISYTYNTNQLILLQSVLHQFLLKSHALRNTPNIRNLTSLYLALSLCFSISIDMLLWLSYPLYLPFLIILGATVFISYTHCSWFHNTIWSELYLSCFQQHPWISLYLCTAVIVSDIIHAQWLVAFLAICVSMKIPLLFLWRPFESDLFQFFLVAVCVTRHPNPRAYYFDLNPIKVDDLL